MQEHDAMSRIFRIALLIFATTFGVGIYALIGAPVLRINYGSVAGKIGAKVASVGESTLRSIPIPRLIPQKGAIHYELTTPSNDFPLLKDLLTSSEFGSQTTREISFTENGKPVSGQGLFTHFSSGGLPPNLGHLLLDQRYFVKHDDAFHGALFVSIVDTDATYAAMLENEALLAQTLMNLAHPTMSISEVRMFTKIRFVSRKIGAVDARAITTSDDAPILIWGIENDLLIIAGDEKSFLAATENDHV